nr:aldolase/citrate lyase family protein [Rhodococcus sp. JVH1]
MSRQPQPVVATRTFLEKNSAWVRVNPATTPQCEKDLVALHDAPGLLGVMVAKTESATHVDYVASALHGTPVVALVESALGVEHAFDIASARATARLAFGTGIFVATPSRPIGRKPSLTHAAGSWLQAEPQGSPARSTDRALPENQNSRGPWHRHCRWK